MCTFLKDMNVLFLFALDHQGDPPKEEERKFGGAE